MGNRVHLPQMDEASDTPGSNNEPQLANTVLDVLSEGDKEEEAFMAERNSENVESEKDGKDGKDVQKEELHQVDQEEPNDDHLDPSREGAGSLWNAAISYQNVLEDVYKELAESKRTVQSLTSVNDDLLQKEAALTLTLKQIHDQLMELRACHTVDEKRERKGVDSKMVKLNVGGTVFVTSTATLRSKPSVLSSLDYERDEFFLDRSPTFFPLVLEYLRKGRISCDLTCLCPRDADGLYAELEYFELNDFAHQLAWSAPSLMHQRKPNSFDRAQLCAGSAVEVLWKTKESKGKTEWVIAHVLSVSPDGSHLFLADLAGSEDFAWFKRDDPHIAPLGTHPVTPKRLFEYLTLEYTCSLCGEKYNPPVQAVPPSLSS